MVAWSRLGGSWIRCWGGRAWHITRSLFSGFSVLFFFYFISPWLQTVWGTSVVWEALGLYEGGPARLGGKALIYIRCKKGYFQHPVLRHHFQKNFKLNILKSRFLLLKCQCNNGGNAKRPSANDPCLYPAA